MTEIVVKSTLLLALGGVVAWKVVQHRPAAAHLVWTTVFLGAILIPLLGFLVRPSVTVHVPMPEAPRGSTSHVQDLEAPSDPLAGSPPREASSSEPSLSWEALFLAVWAAGAVAIAFRYGSGWWQISAFRRSHSCVVDPTNFPLDPTQVARRLGISQNWELRQSTVPCTGIAMTWGVLRPVVLLPHDAGRWPQAKLEAVLLHELAHVRRRDFVSQLLAETACALYWFNPLAWFGARAMREAAEAAADDAVLRSGIKASDYASLLLQFAAEINQRSRAPAQVGVSVMSQSKIESRLRSVLSPTARNRGLTSIHALVTVAVVTLSVAAMAAMQVRGSSSNQDEAKEAMLRARNLAMAMQIYCTDYDDHMPYALSTASVKSVISPYVKDLFSFRSPTRGGRFEFNLNLGGVYLPDIEKPAQVPQWVEWLPGPNASAVSFVDGHAELLEPSDQKKLLKALSKTYPRKAGPLPKNYFPYEVD